MKSIDFCNERIEEIKGEIMALVENQSISLTQKNQQMEPLVEETKVLEHTLVYLERIKNTDYKGSCNPNR
jgi:hypothetical protein